MLHTLELLARARDDLAGLAGPGHQAQATAGFRPYRSRGPLNATAFERNAADELAEDATAGNDRIGSLSDGRRW
ncbi:hypothetical protein C491_04595 [Natronococcus amylolyticus DSM 10524]|uniref:Uncharacterized protein n=1 Tax=Natronococcus amylolyticus DSM 10524 TaxID=1227497 RepID=L9XG25_9EURY|nr:hypothetical protein [Natronococcus amylolyticus]ELY60547.1 hypothetical protein C491_04595 [Natronococcus amylolyticus DSM 10524]